jgi:hypothetical protein
MPSGRFAFRVAWNGTGGLDAPDNVVPACLRCNQSKGAKSLLFWLLTSQYARDVTAGKPNSIRESDRAVP